MVGGTGGGGFGGWWMGVTVVVMGASGRWWVIERQNRSLCEAARTMLSSANLPLYFWAVAIGTACFKSNQSSISDFLSHSMRY